MNLHGIFKKVYNIPLPCEKSNFNFKSFAFFIFKLLQDVYVVRQSRLVVVEITSFIF